MILTCWHPISERSVVLAGAAAAGTPHHVCRCGDTPVGCGRGGSPMRGRSRIEGMDGSATRCGLVGRAGRRSAIVSRSSMVAGRSRARPNRSLPGLASGGALRRHRNPRSRTVDPPVMDPGSTGDPRPIDRRWTLVRSVTGVPAVRARVGTAVVRGTWDVDLSTDRRSTCRPRACRASRSVARVGHPAREAMSRWNDEAMD